MERIRNKFVSKMGIKKYYQKLPCDDFSGETKIEDNQESDKENKPVSQPETNSSLEIKPPPRMLSFLQGSKTGREDRKVKYTQLKSNGKYNNQINNEEIYSNSFTEDK